MEILAIRDNYGGDPVLEDNPAVTMNQNGRRDIFATTINRRSCISESHRRSRSWLIGFF